MTSLRYTLYIYCYRLSIIPAGVRLRDPAPPPQKIIVRERHMLVELQQKLRVFLDALLHEPSLSSRYEVKKFLDPSNYTEMSTVLTRIRARHRIISLTHVCPDTPFRDVSMLLRSKPAWNVHKPLKDIGKPPLTPMLKGHGFMGVANLSLRIKDSQAIVLGRVQDQPKPAKSLALMGELCHRGGTHDIPLFSSSPSPDAARTSLLSCIMEVSLKTQTCLGREMKSSTLNGARSINRITLTMLYGQTSLLFSLRVIKGRAAGRLANPLVPKPKPR